MKDKVIIITGASSGIGKALALKFGLAESRLVITGRNADKLEQTTKELRSKGIVVTGVVADASIESDCAAVIKAAIGEYGRIDVLINNAGISMRAFFEDIQLDVFRKVMDVNFFGMVYTTKYALPHILQSKGSIVGVSSVNGRRATPARSAYAASKFAIVGFLESLRTEVMHKGVHVLTVCPGYTTTNIRKAALLANGAIQGNSPRDESRMMGADAVAECIYTAVLKRRRDLLLTMQGKLAVWLNQFFPNWMDRQTIQFMAKEEGPVTPKEEGTASVKLNGKLLEPGA